MPSGRESSRASGRSESVRLFGPHAAPFLFAQAFGLGGVIGSFGLVLDLTRSLLLLIFVLASSLVLLARADAMVARPMRGTG
jgi:hypothetical protein